MITAGRLSDKDKKKIIADYVQCENYSEAARMNGVSATYVKKLVVNSPDGVKRFEQKKEQNTLDMLEYLATKAGKAQNLIDLCLEYMSKPEKLAAAQVNQLSTVMGTTIDKFAPISALQKKDEGVYRMDSLLIADGFQRARRDILNRSHTEYVFPGGRGSTKSSFVGLMTIELLKNNPQCHMLALRHVSNTLKDSVYAQLKWAIREQGLESEFEYKTSPLEITCKATGQKVYFRGADDPLKIKSIKPEFGYIGIVWFEELDQYRGEEAVRSIEQSAIRGGDTAWIFKTFNPPKTKDNWANKFIQSDKEKRFVMHSTYIDAMVPPAWLGKTFIEEAEYLKAVNPRAYEHEYLGVPNSTGGMIFDNISDRRIADDEIARFDRIYNGVDWGYYPDPWAFNRVYFNAAERTLYIFDEAREYKMIPRKTGEIVKRKIGTNESVTCDSSPPENAADYREQGITTLRAEKGPGSVERRHEWLQGLHSIVIDRLRCPHTYEEFTGYEYERSKDGEVISGYPDKDNHHIDAVCYATEKLWKYRESRKPFFPT